MKKFFYLVVAVFFLLQTPSAYADQEDCPNKAVCDCLRHGICGHVGGRPPCIARIVAPTYGGTVVYDVRDEKGNSLFPDGARKKHVRPGETFAVGINCKYLRPPTAHVYLCVDGQFGPEAVSIRWRHKGDLDRALKSSSRVLHMCLKGDKCDRFVPGNPPVFGPPS